jgi:muramoyltetrapeptide carboxypeptidase
VRSPAPLKPGDLIAITAPSAGVAAPMHGRLDAFAGLNLPVICDLDIGHVPPQLSIWMGAWGRLEISGSGAHLTQTRPSASA